MSEHRKHRALSDAEIEEMREQRAAGMLVREIASVHDRDCAFVSRLLTGDLRPRAGGPIASTARLKLTDAERSEILQRVSVSRYYLGKEVSARALAEKYGVDRRTLQSRVLDQAIGFIARFWAKVDRTGGPEACWPWLGGLLQRIGQPREKWPGRYCDGAMKAFRPHRLAYELTFGAIPRGRILIHTAPLDPRCANPSRCVNPLHVMPSKPKGRVRKA